MIFVLGGTIDARLIVERIAADALPVRLQTLTQYGASLAGSEAQCGALSANDLEKNIENAWAVIDATHPYAVTISQEAMDAARKQNKRYLRYERAQSCSNEPGVYRAANHEQAAQMACDLCDCGNLFLTIGTRGLAPYVAAARNHNRGIFARILPVEESLRAAREAGLTPAEIVAMQGPISLQMEQAFLNFYGIDVLVTKDSGPEGGTDAKFDAAQLENVKVVVVDRPKLNYPWQTSDMETLLREVRHIVQTRG